MSLVKHPDWQGAELKVYNMSASIIVTVVGFAIWALYEWVKIIAEENALDKYLREQLAYNGIDVSNVKVKLNREMFRLIMEGNGK